MAVVGYTETYIKVRGSYGADWGEDGYIRYNRDTSALNACNFFKNAYTVRVDYNRGKKIFIIHCQCYVL